MGRIDLDAKRALVARLRSVQASGAPITEVVRFASESMGVHPSTVWRWLADGAPERPGPTAWQVTDESVRALYICHGRPVIAWRMLRADGVDVPSRQTFGRCVRIQISRGERAYMAAGENGRRRYSVYRRWEPADRNDVWEADHQLLDVVVRVLKRRDLVRPWLTTIIDGHSRIVMGWVLSVAEQPTTAEVLTAIREGIVVDQSRGPWGGVPDLIRFDRGKEFLADAVSQAGGRLGFAALPAPGYSPHKKGKIERMHRTIGEGLVATLPHYLHAARSKTGKLYKQSDPLTYAELQEVVRTYVDDYNHSHKHRSLRGLTPAEKWDMSSRVLEIVPNDQLRWMLLSATTRVVNKDGIQHKTFFYTAPELHGRGGDTVEVRFMPHDFRTIEVFQDGEWICTAVPHDQIVDELSSRFDEQQTRLNRAMGARRAAASRQQSRRIAPLTATGKIEELPKKKTKQRRPPELSNARLDNVLRLEGLADRLNTADTEPRRRKRGA